MNSGADMQHTYHMSEPTPRLRSSSPVVAGARGTRGSSRAPGGARIGAATNRDAINVTTVSVADTPTTPQKSLSPAGLALVADVISSEARCHPGRSEGSAARAVHPLETLRDHPSVRKATSGSTRPALHAGHAAAASVAAMSTSAAPAMLAGSWGDV